MAAYTCAVQRLCRGEAALLWIVLVLVAAVAIGPILYLLPSKRDKRAAAFRREALQAGLVVELAHVPKLDAAAAERVSAGGKRRDPAVDCVAYRLPLPKRLPAAPRWYLLRSEGDDQDMPGWTALQPPASVPKLAADYWRDVRAIVEALPPGCVGLQADAGALAWLGHEVEAAGDARQAVARVRDALAAIGELHRRLDAAARREDS